MQLYKRCSYVVVELEVRYSNIKPLGVFQHVLLTVTMFILQNLTIGGKNSNTLITFSFHDKCSARVTTF